jgi:RNA-binding protein NOB1
MSIKAEYLVVDSVGFLKNAPLRELATNLVTLTEVVGELRDKETRQRLEVMPFDLTYRQPSAEAVKKISDFARKTGDYASLSAVDIRYSYLIALAVGQLDMVRVGPRSLVWGEKKQLELAKIDFSETEEMLTTAESLCGPYVWGDL